MYKSTSIDLFVSLIADGVLEAFNQVWLIVYYAMYINKTGLSSSNLLSVVTNGGGMLLKVIRIVSKTLENNNAGQIAERKLVKTSNSSTPSDIDFDRRPSEPKVASQVPLVRLSMKRVENPFFNQGKV